MAQKAKKDRAKSNTTTLNSLLIGTFFVHFLFLIFNYIRRRSLLAYVLLSIPSFAAQYILETTGRPKYDPSTKALKSSGEDLSSPGLTEYMLDVIWVTWASLVAVMIFGSWGWLLWAVVPVYGLYKGYGLLGMVRGVAGSPQGGQTSEEPVAGSGNRRQRRAA